MSADIIENNCKKAYYEAYDERYKTAHQNGLSWSSDQCTPIVMKTIDKYGINKSEGILEIGCGEGRDAKVLLKSGYKLTATDISPEAIRYCKSNMPEYQNCFSILNCINGEHQFKYKFIYAVAVIHMLVLDEDRRKFYQFIEKHLTNDGVALICTMGDGISEIRSDISKAFEIQIRKHETGEMAVAGTSCRMISFKTFESEIGSNNLYILEKGITESLPDFNSLMFAVVRKKA